MPPSAEAPAANLELFIEGHLGAKLDQHAQMEPALLGFTEFFADAPPRVSINAALTGSALDEDETPPGVLGRFRATLAHEAAHIVLHRSFVESGSRNLDLFRNPRSKSSVATLHKCLKSNASFQRVTDWREYQANAGMAALLMPRLSFLELARRQITKAFPGRAEIPAGGERSVAAALAVRFEVSRQAAAIRLETLGLLARGQGSLA